MSKPPVIFKAAPRPKVDPEAARRMSEESADLGFTRTTSAPRPDAPASIPGGGEPAPDSATAPLPERAIEPSSDRPVEQSTDEPTAPAADSATAPSSEGESAPSAKRSTSRSAERARARRANIAIGQGRNAAIAQPLERATAQLAKGHFAPIAGTVKLDVQDPLWTELRVQAAQRRVSIRYLVHEALAAHGYTVNLDEIPPDGRRVR